MATNDWKLPLNLAIGLHVLLLVSSVYLPGLFKAKPKFAEITTVSIINIAEPQLAAPAPPEIETSQPVVKSVVKPVQTKKIAPIAEPEPVQPQAPAKAVSLKPLKKKVKKKIEEPKTNLAKPKAKPNNKREEELARKRRQALADAIRQEELLAEKARLANEALEMEKSLLTQQRPITSPVRSTQSPSTGSSAQTSSDGSSSKIEAMYYAAIKNRLIELWAVPESIQKKSSLMATAVITIKRNGEIADIFFEKQSGNMVFDQSVKKTIRAANPMQPIPPALKRQRIEFGLNFRPSGIQ